MSVEVVTFGCRLNAYESEVIRGHATRAGAENTIVFNTCAVTSEAERQARQAIRKARREHPGAKIIVTGCAAQIDPAKFAAMPEVDQVLGNEEKLKADSYAADRHCEEPRAMRQSSLSREMENWIASPLARNDDTPSLPPTDFGTEKILVNDIMSVKETASHMVTAFEGKARAFLQVQNGCDHRCTFCIIPYGRGNSRSVPIGEIVAQARLLVGQGFKELVITGVDLTSYGKDLPGEPTLGQMIRRLLALLPELPRLRLSSIDAVEVDEDLFRLIAEEPRLMPHLHLSLQAGDDMILKRMKRRHSRAQSITFCEQVRSVRPDVAFGADLIAGFPTEDDIMFENTLALVGEAGLTYLHVFPYSARPGTPAAKMPQVPGMLRKERAARLREAGELQLAAFLASRVGKTERVIIEEPRRGRTEQFAPVVFADVQTPGAIVEVRIAGVEGALLA